MALIHEFRKVISSAEILALHDTPQLIIPAQGPNSLICILFALYNCGASSYTTTLCTGLFYGDPANGDPADFAATITGAQTLGFASTIIQSGAANNATFGLAGGAPAQVLNQPINLGTSGVNPTVGTTPVTITGLYSIINPN